MRHVEHHGLEEGNHVATEREILIHAALRQTGKVGTLLAELLGQGSGLPALHPSACLVQSLDVGTQLLLERGIVCAVHGHLRPYLLPWNGAEVDAADGAVGQHLAEVSLPLADGGRCVPVEADAHPLRHRARAHTRLSVYIARVERQAHDLEMRLLVGIRLERIKLVYLIHLRVKNSSFRIGQTLNKGGIRHVGIYLLDDEPFGTAPLVLVRSLGLHLLLPLLLALHVLAVTQTDILQDVSDGVADAILPSPRLAHQAVHQRGFVVHIVDVAEGGLPQVRPECRKDGMRYGRLINLRRAAHEQLDEWRQSTGHRWRGVDF